MTSRKRVASCSTCRANLQAIAEADGERAQTREVAEARECGRQEMVGVAGARQASARKIRQAWIAAGSPRVLNQ